MKNTGYVEEELCVTTSSSVPEGMGGSIGCQSPQNITIYIRAKNSSTGRLSLPHKLNDPKHRRD